MHSLRQELRREFRYWRTDHLTQFLLLWLPILGCTLLLGIFQARIPTQLPTAVIDRDQSTSSRTLVAQLAAAPAIHIQLQTQSIAAAREAVQSGVVYAVVEIPQHFHRDVLRGSKPQLGLLVNQQAISAANAISHDVQTVVLTAAGETSAMMRAAAGIPLPEAAALAQPLQVQMHPLYNPGLDYAAFLGIALIAATLHCFAALHGARCIASEGENWRSAGWSRFAAKLLPAFVWWWLWGLLLMFASFRWLGLAPLSAPWLFAAGWAALVAAYLGLGATLAILFPAHIAYSGISVISGPAVAFSGITFPLGAMPLPPRLYGESLPLTWFLHLQNELVTERLPTALALPTMLRILYLALPLCLAAILAFCWQRSAMRKRSKIR